MTKMSDMTQVGRNLYRSGSKYYRLFAHGVTPNSCYLITPVLRQLLDIDTATGNDVYGEETIDLGTGAVVASVVCIWQ